MTADADTVRNMTGTVRPEPGHESREKFTFGDGIGVGPSTVDTGGPLTHA